MDRSVDRCGSVGYSLHAGIMHSVSSHSQTRERATTTPSNRRDTSNLQTTRPRELASYRKPRTPYQYDRSSSPCPSLLTKSIVLRVCTRRLPLPADCTHHPTQIASHGSRHLAEEAAQFADKLLIQISPSPLRPPRSRTGVIAFSAADRNAARV